MRKLSHQRRVLLQIAGLALSSCNYDRSLPNDGALDECYIGEGVRLRLKNGEAISDGKTISHFRFGKDDNGSYVVFKPALHIIEAGMIRNVGVNDSLQRNFLPTNIEMGHTVILMPTEPLGQIKLVSTNC